MAQHLLDGIKITVVANAAVAGTSDVAGSISDMAEDGGYDEVMYIAILGDVTATSVLTLNTQQNTANSTSGMASLPNAAATYTAAASDADNKCLVSDTVRPLERYVRPVLTRGIANAVVQAILCIRAKGRISPAARGDVIAFARAVNPSE